MNKQYAPKNDLSPGKTVKPRIEDAVVIPVVEETLRVGTRTVETGSVQVHKQVQEHQEIVNPELHRQTIQVQTVEVNRIIDGPLPTDRQEGDTLIVPVIEEILVVEKRLLLKSEIHIRRVEETFHQPQTVVLRREEVTVERHDAPDSSDTPELTKRS